MSQTYLDRVIAYLSPRWAAERTYYRDAIEAFSNSYRGGVSSRTSRPWATDFSVAGQTTIQRQAIADMRNRARQLDRDNAMASAILDRATENVVGVGISLRAATKNKAFNEAADKEWARWCRICDIAGRFSFSEVQQLLYRQKLRDGDVGCILVDRGGEPKLQLIEGERISTPYASKLSPSLIDGVEVNRVGRPVRFHIETRDEYGKQAWEPISADNFVFLARLKMSNAIRGLTAFAQGFGLFDNLEGYIEGSVVASRVAANQSLLIKKHSPGNAIGQLASATNGAGNSQRLMRQEPGMVWYLNPDEDVVQMNPNHPSQVFSDFVSALARFTGLNFGLTLEQVMLDFSRANYSSSRAARLQAEATAAVEQNHFYDVVLARVWQWWISKTVNNGLLPPAPEDYWAHEWIPQGRPWVDPTKEIQAAAMAIDLGIESRTNVAQERGYKFRDLVRTNADDRKLLEQAGLPLLNSTLTRDPATAAAQQPSVNSNNEDDANDDKDGSASENTNESN